MRRGESECFIAQPLGSRFYKIFDNISCRAQNNALCPEVITLSQELVLVVLNEFEYSPIRIRILLRERTCSVVESFGEAMDPNNLERK